MLTWSAWHVDFGPFHSKSPCQYYFFLWFYFYRLFLWSWFILFKLPCKGIYLCFRIDTSSSALATLSILCSFLYRCQGDCKGHRCSCPNFLHNRDIYTKGWSCFLGGFWSLNVHGDIESTKDLKLFMGAWVAQSVKHLPWAQVMIPGSWNRAPCRAPPLFLPSSSH